MKAKRKMVMVEVETTLSNKDLKDVAITMMLRYAPSLKVIQVQVNLVSPKK